MSDIQARLSLLSLDQMGPSRARWILGEREAPLAVEELRRGRIDPDAGRAPAGVTQDMIDGWGQALRRTDGAQLVANHAELGMQMMAPSDHRWPFADDPDPPVLIFFVGDIELVNQHPAVAVVGTRRCTTVGRTVAYRLGQQMAESQVPVISGLALGIDGAAHQGVLDHGGSAIGIVGSGLDVIYPGGNRALWSEIGAGGLLLSEAPAGSRPQRWRFPARNRLIASLCDGVVIVESHSRGGSLLTAEEAVERDKAVFTVPGSVLSPASDGTNALLVDGAIPARNAGDVLAYLGLTIASSNPRQVQPVVDSELAAVILAEAATGPVHLDRLVLASGASISDVLAVVYELVGSGTVALDGSTVLLLDQ